MVSLSANGYIRQGATGDNDGSSWANAWTSFGSATWTRGATNFIASGIYTSATITVAESGELWVTLKKANAADNSGDAGWDASYAVGQAVISNKLQINASGRFRIDGVTGSGTNGHGIKIAIQPTNDTAAINIGSYSSYWDFEGVELAGPGYGSQYDGMDLFYFSPTTSQKGLRIVRCYIHGNTRNGLCLGRIIGTSWEDYGLYFRSNVLAETGAPGDPAQHGQGVQLAWGQHSSYILFQDSVFKDITGSGMIVFMTSSSHDNARIINNIFYHTGLTTASGYTLSPHIIGDINNGKCTNIFIANNTFYGIAADNLAQVRFYGADTDNVTFTNNLFESCNFTATHTVTSQGYNGYYNNSGGGVPSGTPNQVNGASTTFNAPASYDFTLKAGGYAVGTGADLSAIFTTDILGRTRSTWDIGAYAFTLNRANITNLRVKNLHIGGAP